MLDIVLVMFELRKLCQTFYLTNLDADILNIRRNMPQKVKVGEGGSSDIYLKKIGGGVLEKITVHGEGSREISWILHNFPLFHPCVYCV